jgi:hypothetical protein
MDRYEFDLRQDREDETMEELDAQDLAFKVEFAVFIEKTNGYGWSQKECLELLDQLVETYAIEVAPGDPRRAMLAREVDSDGRRQDRYVYLGISFGGDHKNNIYQEVCDLYQLDLPLRQPCC